MRSTELRKIEKPYFGYEDIARVLNISPASAKVAASRYVRAGILIRIKQNLYVLYERWSALSLEQKFSIANIIQVPSYVSLFTALSHYEITTQIQQDYIESVALRRTRTLAVETTVFQYTKIKPQLYFGFKRVRGFFIAEPEKAFLDALYLQSLGRRSISLSSLDLDKFDWAMVVEISRLFPKRTQRLVQRYERLRKT